MIIKSIKLENFRQYKGSQDKIEFSTDPNNNVTVILGANTSGKTTLIQAFRWCLYGNASVSFPTKEVLNSEILEELNVNDSADVIVVVEFIHDNINYSVKRTQSFKKTEKTVKAYTEQLFMMYKHEDGSQKPIEPEEVVSKIEKILPQELSEYFFFDGEKIADISKKTNIKKAVHSLLGLDILNNTKIDLEKVSKKFVPVVNDGGNLHKSLEETGEELENLIQQIDKAKEEIQFYEERGSELSDLILANIEQKHNQEERLKREKSISEKEEDIHNFRNRVLRDFNNDSVSFFAAPSIKKALEIIKNAETMGEGIPDMRIGAIDFLLNRNKCICGIDLSSDANCRNRVNYERALLPPAHIGTTLREISKTYDWHLDQVKSYKIEVNDSVGNLNRAIKQKHDLELERDEYTEKIKGDINVSKIEDDSKQNKLTIKSLYDKKEQLDSRKGEVTKEKQIIEDKINNQAVVSKENERIVKCQKISNELLAYFKGKYEERQVKIKEKLLESINNTFQKIYHGTRELSMDDDYQIKLTSNIAGKKVVTDESKGLETVKNFSFICGLIDFARQKIENQNNQIKIITESYPLVMDAPFSNTDKEHIENISKTIPDIAEQVILMIMEKDWENAEETLGSRAAIKYSIDKIQNSDTYSMIRRI